MAPNGTRGRAAALPERVFTKASATLGSRILLGITGITEGEATFFNQLRPLLELRGPRGFFAAAREPILRFYARSQRSPALRRVERAD